MHSSCQHGGGVAQYYVIVLPDEEDKCNPHCENGGTCISPGLCQCTAEWIGDTYVQA